jgi:protein involved in polysaccharide export with SLBB domain
LAQTGKNKKEAAMKQRYLQHRFWLNFSHLWQMTALVFPFLWGCGRPITVPLLTPDQVANVEAAGNYPERNYHLEPGDTIKIAYPFHSDMNQDGAIIQPDGKISATQVGEVVAGGLTTAELEKILVERTSDRLRNPEVVVTVSKFSDKSVYIAGEVGKPGLVPYTKDITPLQAVVTAGGFKETAMIESVILIRPVMNGDPITRKIDLATVLTEGNKELVRLAPHDIVYVPKTAIAEADLWVKQHLTDLVPFVRGVGASSALP